MINKFRNKKSDRSKKYTYIPPTSPRDEEVAIYKKLMLTAVLVIGLAVGLYIWGVPLIVQLGSVWNQFGADVPEQIQPTPEITVITPRLNPLPSTIRDPKEVTISGTGPSGHDIAIYINETKQVTVLADATGNFVVKDLKLQEGENVIYAKTIQNDTESDASNKQIVVYDITPPAISIISPAPGTTTKENTIDIIGTTETQAKVTINEVQVIVNATTGDFTRLVTLQNGENVFTIVASDKANNQKTITLTIIKEASEEQSQPAPEVQ